MIQTMGFLDNRRLLYGPWQAFERDVARLMILNGFDDVRIVGGAGDKGGDILAVKAKELWVVQCKHTTVGPPPVGGVTEVVSAGEFYKADRLLVATSRPPTGAFWKEIEEKKSKGIKIDVAPPSVLLDLMNRAPEYPPSRHNLRDYQEEASTRLREGLLDTGRAQIVMATGLGKTVVMAETVADMLRDKRIDSNRILVVAHTREIVKQLHLAFWFQLPKWIATHQLLESESPAYWDGITFATVQSVRLRMESLPRFGLVLIDEAHHVGMDTFREVIQALSPPMLGGVTATPWRGDEFDIDQLLGPPRFKMGIAQGLRHGFLTEVDYRLLGDNLDWEIVQEASRNRYSLSQLNRRLIIPTRDDKAAQIIGKVFQSERLRGGLVFSPSIVHADSFSATLRSVGLRCETIASSLTHRERDVLMTRFREGQLDFLATVDLFNEGVDFPDVDTIVFMRVTHSRRIFVQQLGRGLRVVPGKSRVVVLDFVTDLRRIAEVVELDTATKGGEIEHLGLGSHLIEFTDKSAGSFLREWMLDQASLINREGDPDLLLPKFNFPLPPHPGSIQ